MQYAQSIQVLLAFAILHLQIHHPIDYAKVVQRVGNEMDLTLVNLEDIMPAATIMVLTVTATTTSGKELSQVRMQSGHWWEVVPLVHDGFRVWVVHGALLHGVCYKGSCAV